MKAIIEYIVFFGMFAAALIFYWLHEKRPVEPAPILEPERYKCESPIERRLYDALKSRGEFVKTQVQCGKYRIDIVLPAYNIAIECDGKAYHSTASQKAHDKKKNAYLRSNGWKVLRFSGKSIFKNIKWILMRIEEEKHK